MVVGSGARSWEPLSWPPQGSGCQKVGGYRESELLREGQIHRGKPQTVRGNPKVAPFLTTHFWAVNASPEGETNDHSTPVKHRCQSCTAAKLASLAGAPKLVIACAISTTAGHIKAS